MKTSASTLSDAPEAYRQTGAALAQQLQVDVSQGLTDTAVAHRLQTYGPNEIPAGQQRPWWRMLASQFTDFMILVLLAAALVSGIVGEPEDAIAIVLIVLLNAIIGTVQEYRAERAMAALRQLAAPQARVLRGGVVHIIAARELVPGDIVQLEAGNIVPADIRLLDTAQLQIDEAALTGESLAVAKHTEPLSEVDLPLGDRRNMAYKGTQVSVGRGTGMVVATGLATELGNIAQLLAQESTGSTPLQQRLARLGRQLAIAVLVICAVLFVVGLLRGEPPVLMFLTAVSLAVAAIPEALPAVVTVALALGAARMSRCHSLIRRLPAVETLGSVTVICSDKTGTLTENRMRAEAFVVDGEQQAHLPEFSPEFDPAADAGSDPARQPWLLLTQALALSNDVIVQEAEPGQVQVLGDPTEVALYQAARDAGCDKTDLSRVLPRVAELPFDSVRKRMSTLHDRKESVLAFTKGAPEQVLAVCTTHLTAAGPLPLEPAAVLHQAEQLARSGYRVLALAYRSVPQVSGPAALAELAINIEQDLTLLGLVALIDPPRAEAPAAVAACLTAGIRPVMITGDHPGTALAIAQRLGIAHADDTVVTGRDLERLAASESAARMTSAQVYARVSPEQKIQIVQALQSQGDFVAMTGDGVNDAPALKRADIGVAMGQRGTEVAREAADMVLLDDNFATIVAAVREGRRIFDNIRKFVKYTLTSNAGEIWTLALAPLLGLPIPLLPIHILWINLVTDGLPGLALAAEPAERNVMQRPPRPPQESIFAHGVWQHVIWCGLLIGGLSLGAQAWAYGAGMAHWQTMVFTVLTLAQLVHVLAIRSERESILTLGLLSNRPLLGAVLLTVMLQLAVIYLPVLNPIFNTAPLSLAELAICFALASLVLLAVEVEKALIRRGYLYAVPVHANLRAPLGE
ncbi:MAG: cation-translocating P-type ATPase [Gammaproteobacteria bacterium]